MSDRQTELNEAWANQYLAPHVKQLTRYGSDWLMCSPLREDHNPSFSVNVEKGAYNDFATGEKGTLSELAERMNVPAPIYEKTGQEAGRSENPAAKEAREAQSRIDTAKIETARAIWEAAVPDLGEHRYIAEKGLAGLPLDVRRLNGGAFKYPKENGFSEVRGAGQLVVPMYDVRTRELVGVELIDNAKGRRRPDKHAKEQYRAKSENFPAVWEAGTCSDEAAPVVLCEGMATAASVKQIVGGSFRVLCCFSSENVPSIGRAIAKRFPSLRLIVATDADRAGEAAFLELVNGKRKEKNGRPLKDFEYPPLQGVLEVRPAAEKKRKDETEIPKSIDERFAAEAQKLKEETKEGEGAKTDWNDIVLRLGLDKAKEVFFLRLMLARERAKVGAMTKQQITEAITLAELYERKQNGLLPSYEWLVPEMFPSAGVCVLGGVSGAGKSFLAQRLAIEAARGGVFLGRKVEKADVLYCALEDPAPMFVDRLEKVFQVSPWEFAQMTNFTTEGIGTGEETAAETGQLRLDKQGIPYFTEWIISHSGAARRLIVIDVAQEIMPDSRSNRGDAYTVIYETLSPLKLLAARTNTCILLIHHASNKNGAMKGGDPFDKMIGSVAWKAATQARFLIDEGSVETGHAVLVRSVKGAKPFNLPLRWDDTGAWRLATDEENRKEEIAALKEGLSINEAAIMDFLNEHPESAFSLKEIADCTNVTYTRVRQLSKKLQAKGLIKHNGMKVQAVIHDFFSPEDEEKNSNDDVLERTPVNTQNRSEHSEQSEQKNIKKNDDAFTKDFSVHCSLSRGEVSTLTEPREGLQTQDLNRGVHTVHSVHCSLAKNDFLRFSPDSLLRQYDENGKAPPILQAVGESLASLAARAGVSVEELRESLDDEENADLSGRFDLRDGVLIVAPMEEQNENGGSPMDETNGAARDGDDSLLAVDVAQGAEVSL